MFVEVYRELNRLMGENQGLLNPVVGNKAWDKVQFPMTVGEVQRTIVFFHEHQRKWLNQF